MKKHGIIFLFGLILCMFVACNSVKETENIDEVIVDSVVNDELLEKETEYIEDSADKSELLEKDTLNIVEVDPSDIDSQINTIVNNLTDREIKRINYYTVADLNNNGHLEFLWSTDDYQFEIIELSDNYSTLIRQDRIPMLVTGKGEMTLKCYELKGDYLYVAYGSYGDKMIFFSKSKKSESFYGPSKSIDFLDDGEEGVLFIGDDIALSDLENAENEYFEEANDKYLVTLNWYEFDGNLDNVQLKEIYNTNSKKDFEEMNEWDSLCAFTGNRIHREKKYDLPNDIINMFEYCAIYCDRFDMSSGNVLSTNDYLDILDFLFYLRCDGTELVHDYSDDMLSRKERIPYDEWEYLLREVYGENNPELIVNKLPDGFTSEMAVYYSKTDDCIYKEVGTVGYGYDYTMVKNVEEIQDGYIITYNVYSDLEGYRCLNTVEVTIRKADNKYGYKLVDVKEVK